MNNIYVNIYSTLLIYGISYLCLYFYGLIIFFWLLPAGYAIFLGRPGFIIAKNELIKYNKLFLILKLKEHVFLKYLAT